MFDPAGISDYATYENPHQHAGGFFYVIVNGNLVVQEATHTGARPDLILKIS
jgi:N-acyl-D-amino-acid deacylase